MKCMMPLSPTRLALAADLAGLKRNGPAMVAWLARVAAVRGRFDRQSTQYVVTLPRLTLCRLPVEQAMASFYRNKSESSRFFTVGSARHSPHWAR
jgi:hypothetical protein